MGEFWGMHFFSQPGRQASGTGLALLSGLLPTFGVPLPLWLRVAGLAIGLILFLWPLLSWLIETVTNGMREDRKLAPLLVIAFGVLLTVAGVAWLYLADGSHTIATANGAVDAMPTPLSVEDQQFRIELRKFVLGPLGQAQFHLRRTCI
jgi:hypothetical protein